MITPEERQQLLAVARQSIRHGLDRGRPLRVDARDYPESLGVRAATFVTLNDANGLRGCIGRLPTRQLGGGRLTVDLPAMGVLRFDLTP